MKRPEIGKLYVQVESSDGDAKLLARVGYIHRLVTLSLNGDFGTYESIVNGERCGWFTSRFKPLEEEDE